jgi:hypothetical protein
MKSHEYQDPTVVDEDTRGRNDVPRNGPQTDYFGVLFAIPLIRRPIGKRKTAE